MLTDLPIALPTETMLPFPMAKSRKEGKTFGLGGCTRSIRLDPSLDLYPKALILSNLKEILRNCEMLRKAAILELFKRGQLNKDPELQNPYNIAHFGARQKALIAGSLAPLFFKVI